MYSRARCGTFSSLCICRGNSPPPDPSELVSALRGSLAILADQPDLIDSSLVLWLSVNYGTIWRASSSTMSWSNRLSHVGLLSAIGGGLVALIGRQSLADHSLHATDRHEATRINFQAFISASSSLLQIAVCLLLSSIAARFGFSTPLVNVLAATCLTCSSLAACIIAFRLGCVVAQSFTRRLRLFSSAGVHTAYHSHHHQHVLIDSPNRPARRTGKPARSFKCAWAGGLSLFLKVLLAVSSTVVSLRRLKKVQVVIADGSTWPVVHHLDCSRDLPHLAAPPFRRSCSADICRDMVLPA